MKKFAVLLILLLPLLSAMAQVKFVAHRGASWYAPENTLASIRLAWELGSDGAECDIRLTKDNKIVLSHDGNSERLTGIKADIATTRYSDLKKQDIKLFANQSPWFSGQKFALLTEVLDLMKEGQMLVIEIKCGEEIFPELKKVVGRHHKAGKIAFIAFSFETICRAKSEFPEVPCYYLSVSKEDVLKRIPAISANRLDGVDLHYRIIDRELVGILRSEKIDIWSWTIDDLNEASRLKELGVQVITTNRPTWLREQMAAGAGK